MDRRQGLGELTLGSYFDHHHRRKRGRHHEGCGLLRLPLVPPRQWVPCRLDVDTQCSLPQTPQQQRQQSHQPQRFHPLGLFQEETVDDEWVLQLSI